MAPIIPPIAPVTPPGQWVWQSKKARPPAAAAPFWHFLWHVCLSHFLWKKWHLASSHSSYHRCWFLNIRFNWWFNWSFIQFCGSVLQFRWEPTMSDAALEDGRHGSGSQHSLSCFRAMWLGLGNVKCFRIQRWEAKHANIIPFLNVLPVFTGIITILKCFSAFLSCRW